MQRRTFIKYSMATGATLILPQTAIAWDYSLDEVITDAKRYGDKIGDFVDEQGKEFVKAAKFCAKLTPARLVVGVIYDEVAETFVKPLAQDIYDWFMEDKKISSYDLKYAGMSEARSSSIAHDPYKASIVVLDEDKTSYRKLQNNQIEIELQRNHELKNFNNARQYLKDSGATITFNNNKTSIVGNDLTPNDLLNTEYIAFGRNQDEHLQNLLEATSNRTFSRLVV